MRSPSVVFTEQQKQEIKQRAAAGEKLYNLCAEYGVARYRITEVVTGIKSTQTYRDEPSAEELRESDIRAKIERVKKYWQNFKAGDTVRLKYYHTGRAKSRYIITDGVILHKNSHFLNVKTKVDILEVRMSDLILERNKTYVGHIGRMG